MEDVLIILAEKYVSERDGLSLAFSSVVASVYGRIGRNRFVHMHTVYIPLGNHTSFISYRTSLDIYHCHFLHSLTHCHQLGTDVSRTTSPLLISLPSLLLAPGRLSGALHHWDDQPEGGLRPK